MSEPATPAESSPPPTDEALALALASDHREALDALMLRWQIPLRSFLYRYTQNHADALDLAQETFVRLYQNRKRYRPGSRFSTWMFQIALNLARDHARRQKHRAHLPLDQAPEPAAESQPNSLADQGESLSALRTAITQLDPALRETLLLSYYQQLPHQEIARLQNATPKAVESRLYRARQQLRQQLARWL